MSDNITLPREVVVQAVKVLSPMAYDTWPRERNEVVATLRARLAAPEPVRHPGYVIGSHWLETAYSRVCAGEAEADVLRDCGWERVTDAEALRRDAERYRWLRVTVYDVSDDRMLRAEELDNAIDAAMEPATEPAIRARGEVPR